MHILPNISRSKDNQRKKFGQLKYNKNILWKNHAQNHTSAWVLSCKFASSFLHKQNIGRKWANCLGQPFNNSSSLGSVITCPSQSQTFYKILKSTSLTGEGHNHIELIAVIR